MLDQAPTVVAFAVTDTGIGIAPEKQQIIFEAFQQADAGTAASTAAPAWAWRSAASSRACSAARSGCAARRARAARSRCTCRSTTSAPADARAARRRQRAARPAACRSSQPIAAGAAREETSPTTATTSRAGDPSLLIVEDDPHYARVLLDLARDARLQGLVANRGSAALRAGARVPARRAITLDIFLPDMLGWTVLDQPEARPGDAPHPGADRHGRGGAPARPRARRVLVPGQAGDHRDARGGASSASRSSSLPRVKRLLVVEDDDVERMSIDELIAPRRHRDRHASAPARRRWRRCATGAFDCVRARPAPARHDRLRAARPRSRTSRRCATLPIVVFTGKELSADEEAAAARRRPRASSSRTCSRPSGCSTRPRCSCTA